MRVNLASWLTVALVALVGAWMAAPVQAQKAENAYAVLIVGDESKPEIVNAEKALISEITKLLVEKDEKGAYKYSRSRSGMQVFSYHINHEREKQFCEKKLNILGEDLLFVGIISLENKLPDRVVYRLDRIVSERRAAVDVFNYAEELLAGEASVPAAPAAQPAPAKSAAPSAPAASAPAKSQASAPKAPASSAPAASTKASVKPAAKRPAAVSRPAASTSSAPVPEGKYLSCQVGAFSKEINAKDLVSQLESKGYSATYRKFERSSGSPFYRVYSGNFNNRADADAALQRLKASGFDKAILVTLDK